MPALRRLPETVLVCRYASFCSCSLSKNASHKHHVGKALLHVATLFTPSAGETISKALSHPYASQPGEH